MSSSTSIADSSSSTSTSHHLANDPACLPSELPIIVLPNSISLATAASASPNHHHRHHSSIDEDDATIAASSIVIQHITSSLPTSPLPLVSLIPPTPSASPPLPSIAPSPSPHAHAHSSSSSSSAYRHRRDFTTLASLGSGSFGTVTKVLNVVDKQIYALKRIRLRHRRVGHQSNESILREAGSLASLNHQNVVRYFSCWIEGADVDDDDAAASNNVVTATPRVSPMMMVDAAAAAAGADRIASPLNVPSTIAGVASTATAAPMTVIQFQREEMRRRRRKLRRSGASAAAAAGKTTDANLSEESGDAVDRDRSKLWDDNSSDDSSQSKSKSKTTTMNGINKPTVTAKPYSYLDAAAAAAQATLDAEDDDKSFRSIDDDKSFHHQPDSNDDDDDDDDDDESQSQSSSNRKRRSTDDGDDDGAADDGESNSLDDDAELECQQCSDTYHDWSVSFKEWSILQASLQPLSLCATCYISALSSVGVDPNTILVHRKKSPHLYLFICMAYCPTSLTNEIAACHPTAEYRKSLLNHAIESSSLSSSSVISSSPIVVTPSASTIAEGRTTVNDKRLWALFEEIVEGVKFLHSNHLLHRDLKPSNILISSSSHVQIADLGLSRVVEECHVPKLPKARGMGQRSASSIQPSSHVHISSSALTLPTLAATTTQRYMNMPSMYQSSIPSSAMRSFQRCSSQPSMNHDPTSPMVTFSRTLMPQTPQQMRDVSVSVSVANGMHCHSIAEQSDHSASPSCSSNRQSPIWDDHSGSSHADGSSRGQCVLYADPAYSLVSAVSSSPATTWSACDDVTISATNVLATALAVQRCEKARSESDLRSSSSSSSSLSSGSGSMSVSNQNDNDTLIHESSSSSFNDCGDSTLTTGVGTAFYTAPELLVRQSSRSSRARGSSGNKDSGSAAQYDSKVDMFSLGVVLFEMWYGPFDTSMERHTVLRRLQSDGIFPDGWDTTHRLPVQLISLLLHPDPRRRPAADALLELLPQRTGDNPLSHRVVALQTQILNQSAEVHALRAIIKRQQAVMDMLDTHMQFMQVNVAANASASIANGDEGEAARRSDACHAIIQRSKAELSEVLMNQHSAASAATTTATTAATTATATLKRVKKLGDRSVSNS